MSVRPVFVVQSPPCCAPVTTQSTITSALTGATTEGGTRSGVAVQSGGSGLLADLQTLETYGAWLEPLKVVGAPLHLPQEDLLEWVVPAESARGVQGSVRALQAAKDVFSKGSSPCRACRAMGPLAGIWMQEGQVTRPWRMQTTTT